MRVVIAIRDATGTLNDFPDVFCEAHARKYLSDHYPYAKWPPDWKHEERTWDRSHREQVIVRVKKDDTETPCVWCPPVRDEQETLANA